jgi:hypothetical protein
MSSNLPPSKQPPHPAAVSPDAQAKHNCKEIDRARDTVASQLAELLWKQYFDNRKTKGEQPKTKGRFDNRPLQDLQ